MDIKWIVFIYFLKFCYFFMEELIRYFFYRFKFKSLIIKLTLICTLSLNSSNLRWWCV